MKKSTRFPSKTAAVVPRVNEERLSRNVQSLEDRLERMPLNMRVFSLSLRSLYVENAVGSDDEAAKEFRKLRDDTRNDAMVYLKCLLPLSTQFVRCLKMYFGYFLHLDFEEWKENFPDIKADAAAYKGVCEALLKGHEEMLVTLNKRQDEARIILAQFPDLQEKYEKEIKELKKEVDGSKSWAIFLSWIPLVNTIAVPMLLSKAKIKLAEALAARSQVQVNDRATFVVRDILIPALESFIQGLSAAAGFFSVMEQELQTIEEASHEEMKRMHYTIMNREAEKMMAHCEAFFAVLPEVRTDFLAIPKKGTDQNYVDKWLEKQKNIIEERCTSPRLFKEMMNAITYDN